ncbi:MAG: nucleotidyltransferase [Geobacter sp.]|nr:MAG: nucleotidyltransferase [Geobacter sp.]
MTGHLNSAGDSAPDDLLNSIMQRIRDFLPLLDQDEILRLLSVLHADVGREIGALQELADRQTALLRQAREVTDYLSLQQIHDFLNNQQLDHFLKVQSVPSLHKNCTEYRDLLAGRALELVVREMEDKGRGVPPLPFSLISMGSDGREEQTLITDQDYLVVYADGGGDGEDDWFREFSGLLVERLAEIGFKKCTGDIMPTNPTWRGSLSQWRKRLLSIMRYEFEDYAKNLMDLIVLSDARYVAGDRDLAQSLIQLIRGLEQDYFQVLWGMAKAATEMKLAIGFLKRIWVEGSGDHKGEFNLKLLAWAPLVMNVRILAINQGVPTTSTLRRIELLQEEKSLSAATAGGLIEAYHVLTRHRIFLQIKVIKGIQKDSYYLNPYELAADEREQIRTAILRIEDLQKIIHTNFSIT